ncbi:hypothetical protein ACQEU3_37435 [Spirillospora sp. CA-253888]
MSTNTPRRHAPTAPSADAPSEGTPFHAERALLGEIAVKLEALGERCYVRRTRSGAPFLWAASPATARLSEEITVVRDGDQVRALWSWGEKLPVDPGQAAAAIRRVINLEA